MQEHRSLKHIKHAKPVGDGGVMQSLLQQLRLRRAAFSWQYKRCWRSNTRPSSYVVVGSSALVRSRRNRLLLGYCASTAGMHSKYRPAVMPMMAYHPRSIPRLSRT